MRCPRVTVAVVCFNEEKNILACLKSLLEQSYSPRDYEILVVDNNSTDRTIEIIKKLQKQTRRIRLVINPQRGIAISRNVALKEARGPLLAFTDADCVAPRGWLKKLVPGYERYQAINPKIVAAGGPNRPPKTTLFYQALDIMLNSFLGSRGSVQARRYEKDRPVPHLPCVNVLYQKKKLIEIDGFDDRFASIIEDEDLSFRLSQKGYQFFYLAQAGLIHKMRDNLWGWTKNMFIYGKGRAWFLKKHPQRLHPYFFLPVILILGAPIVLPIYLPLILIYSLWVAFRARRLDLLGRIYTLYLVTHLSYGLGEIYGFFKKRGS